MNATRNKGSNALVVVAKIYLPLFFPIHFSVDIAHQSKLHQRSHIALVDERCVRYDYKMGLGLEIPPVCSHN